MKHLPHSLVLCFGVLALTGCPGDDDDDSARREPDGGISEAAGAGRAAAGKSGAAAGKSGAAAGKSGAAAGKGVDDGGIGDDQAAAAVCGMVGEMGEMGEFADLGKCTGVEEYLECADKTCGAGACNDGACKDFVDCQREAADPCNADCEQSAACAACYSDVAKCVTGTCFELVKCGETEEGGACDELEECCESQSGPAKMACEAAAQTSRSSGGDKLCETILNSLCP